MQVEIVFTITIFHLLPVLWLILGASGAFAGIYTWKPYLTFREHCTLIAVCALLGLYTWKILIEIETKDG